MERDRRNTAYELRHEVAVVLSGPLAGQVFRAPEIHDLCGGKPSDRLARKVERLSGAHALGCPVCGCPLEKRFGEINRWHFAEARWASDRQRREHSSHEPESGAHRAAKSSLARSLREGLGDMWEVREEAGLESRQRADVLALHTSGTRVAFEVQLAPISSAAWRRRREAYARIGVRDYWLMGVVDLRRSRHAMARWLAAAEGQRLVYVGGKTAEAVERIPQDPRVSPGEAGISSPFRTVTYGLRELRLSPEGTLLTPADAEQERRRNTLRARTRRAQKRDAAKVAGASSWARDGVANEASVREERSGGPRPPRPMPAALSEQALRTAPGWAIEMHRKRQQIARQMVMEEAAKRSER